MLKRILRIGFFIILFFIVLISGLVLLMYRGDIEREALEDKYFTDDSQYIDISIQSLEDESVYLNIHYADMGDTDDPVIVLLHGAFSSLHTFEAWASRLVLSNYRVILIDLPNHGLSGNYSDNTTSIRRQAAVVKAVLDYLDISSCVIGGNSMGGGVSWYFTSEYHTPSEFEVQGLILIDAIVSFEESGGMPEGFLKTLLTSPLKHVLSRMTPKFILRPLLTSAYGSESSFDETTLNRYYELLRKSGNRLAIVNAIHEPPSDDEKTSQERIEIIRDANIPVLVLWGEEDQWIPVLGAEIFRLGFELDDEYVKIYSGIGHVPMEEDPLLTIEDVLLFLGE